MADMFYFASPRQPSGARYQCGRRIIKPVKRSLTRKMDFLNQQARMARHDEPHFYASDIISWYGGCSTLPEQSTTSARQAGEGDPSEETADEDQDGTAQPSDTDQVMTDMFASTSLAPVSTVPVSAHSILPFQSGWPPTGFLDFSPPTAQEQGTGFAILPTPLQDLIGLGSHVPNPASVLGSSHPRPLTDELWEEEDGRRLRFALDGDANQDVPQFALPSINETNASAWDGQPSGHRSWQDNTMLEEWQTYSESAWSGAGRVGSQTMPDEDGLAVDDPKRNYDFSDFLLDWRWHHLNNPELPPTSCNRTDFVASEPRYINHNDIATGTESDMQGIDWASLRCKREDAFTARRALHPSPHYRGDPTHQHSESTRPLDTQYTFKSFNPAHRAHIGHYQLRNVLAASSRDAIYYATRNTVIKTSLALPFLTETVLDLPKPRHDADNIQTTAGFRITCLATSPASLFPTTYPNGSLLLAGGFEGEYALTDLSLTSPTPILGTVTRAYNNLVTHAQLYTPHNSSTALACLTSNDARLRLLNTATNTFTSIQKFETPINCSAISPDSRLRVLVGDTPHALITDAEKGEVLCTLRSHSDHGFACAWSSSGRYVATGAQDGRVCVWDARNWAAPVRELGCRVSCARSLAFCGDGSLVVGEGDDVVAVWGGRSEGVWDRRQEVAFFGSVGGVQVLGGGGELLVANADKSVGGLMGFQRAEGGWRGEAEFYCEGGVGAGFRDVVTRWDGPSEGVAASRRARGRGVRRSGGGGYGASSDVVV